MSAINRNVCLDQLKGIAAIFVVFIHAKFPCEIGEVIRAIARFAVPLFFMVSGYFFLKADKNKMYRTIRPKILHILKIVLIAYSLNLVRIVLQLIDKGGGIKEWFLLNVLTKRHLLEFIIFNNSAFGGVLWFLFSLIYCYLFYGILINKGGKIRICSVYCISNNRIII